MYYIGSFLVFVFSLVVFENYGMLLCWIGYFFLFFMILMYVVIGIVSWIFDVFEYYVVGCWVFVFFNGMVIGVDWMSVVFFMGLVGMFYFLGF